MITPISRTSVRFFILFLFCLLSSGPTSATNAASLKNTLPKMTVDVQILDNIDGLPSCKIGGEINANVGKWLRLIHNGKIFAQICVYDNYNISLAQAGDLSFYQVESSQGDKKLLSLISDQGMPLHVFHTSGPGLQERRIRDGKLLFLWKDVEGSSYETIVGKNEIHTSGDTIGERHWTNLKLEDLQYLGLNGKGMGLIGYGHLFRTKNGQTLDLMGNCWGTSDGQCWHWLEIYQNKPLRILWGDLAFGSGGGLSIYEAMPGLTSTTANATAKTAPTDRTTLQ